MLDLTHATGVSLAIDSDTGTNTDIEPWLSVSDGTRIVPMSEGER